ncbi:MAG TPA: class II glutamine amidotransferase [Ktedonobacterales bacterium]|nr:class II glutamine amidotransferase [Ktedonobacterales bacterium]
MCEMLAIQGSAPGTTFALSEVLPLAAELERLGIAGFGWGVAWHDPTAGRVRHAIQPGALHEHLTDAQASLGSERADAAVIHLRRPTQLSTVGLADTQPFYSERFGCAFAHNGDFARHETLRARYLEQGLLEGKADSEIGFRLFEEELARATGPAPEEEALRQVHARLEGRANLLALMADGRIAAYAHYDDNWMFSCRLGSWEVLVTALYSWDQSVFTMILPEAQSIHQMQPGETLTLPRSTTA